MVVPSSCYITINKRVKNIIPRILAIILKRGTNYKKTRKYIFSCYSIEYVELILYINITWKIFIKQLDLSHKGKKNTVKTVKKEIKH